MLATQILENEDGFRWDIFHEYVCRKLRLSIGMIERSKVLFKSNAATAHPTAAELRSIVIKISLQEDDDAVNAFKLMTVNNIGRIIVKKGEKVSGIVSRTDLLRAVQLLGE